MAPEVLRRLAELEAEYEQVIGMLSAPDVMADQQRFRRLSRRHKELDVLVAAYRRYQAVAGDLAAAREMYQDATDDEREELRRDIESSDAEMASLEEQLRALLLPKDPNDQRNVIVEVRGAEGGEEGNLFAKDLFEMYARFADRKGWKVEVLGSDPSERGGFNQVTFLIAGEMAWSRMKHEGGTHRVQRVPVTESQGRVHTSSATVTVLPEADEIEVNIDTGDLKVDVYRSTGPGGQSVNTTDSAVRVTHVPSGIVVAMQDEKSQIQNRARAMQVLRARLLAAEQDRQARSMAEQRRSQVKGGGRSDKIRTYNYKDNRVTDHRVGLTLHKLDRVLAGDLDEISDALVADDRTRRLTEGE
ncbi:MAG: peptide chain release factor 1 [Acidimicrobiales bacterium]